MNSSEKKLAIQLLESSRMMPDYLGTIEHRSWRNRCKLGEMRVTATSRKLQKGLLNSGSFISFLHLIFCDFLAEFCEVLTRVENQDEVTDSQVINAY